METEDGGETHVYPLFGRDHDMSPQCWCQPVPEADMPWIWVHNVEQ